MEKSEFQLKPLQKLDVSLHITSHNIGATKANLIFHLVYHSSPSKSVQATSKVLGKITVTVSFETLSTTTRPEPQINTGISPKYIRETGTYYDDVKFKSNVKIPRTAFVDNKRRNANYSTDLIAFPNDMQKSLRPWRNANM